MNWIKRYWKIGLCFLGVFLAGAISGGVITAGALRQALVKRTNPENWSGLAMSALERRLDLRPDQVTQIQPIVDSATRELRSIRSSRRIQSFAVLRQTRVQIEPLLNADQQRKFETLVQERQKRFQEFLRP